MWRSTWKWLCLPGILGCGIVSAVELAAPAPRLEPSEWVKGDPIDLESLKGRKNVVVVFYDTFHPLTRPTMLRLRDIARNFAETVNVAAISVETPETVKASPCWELMDFAVATDDGKFAESYLGDREQSPLAFLIDTNGVIAWIGSPMLLQEPLEQVVAGEYDLSAVTAPVNNREQVDEFMLNGNFADAVKTIDQMLLDTPGDVGLIGLKVRILSAMLKRPEEGLIFLKQEIEKAPGNYTLRLFAIASYRELGLNDQADACYVELAKHFQSHPDWLRQEAESILRLGMDKMSLPSAVVLAEAAWRSPDLNDRREKALTAQTLAQVYYTVGRLDLAVDLQQQALKLFTPTTPEADKALVLLRYYESARQVGQAIAAP